MLHSKNFVNDPKFRQSHLDLWECNVKYDELTPTQIDCLGEIPIPDLNHHQQLQQQPVIVQIAGNDINLALKQARWKNVVEHRCHAAGEHEQNEGGHLELIRATPSEPKARQTIASPAPKAVAVGLGACHRAMRKKRIRVPPQHDAQHQNQRARDDDG